MNQNKELKVFEKKQKGFAGALVILGVTLAIGFFVYPNIIHQKPEDVVPGIPTDLEGVSEGSNILISWLAPVDGGEEIGKYLIKVIGTDKIETILDTGSNDTSYTIEGLTNNTEYEIFVAGVNNIGIGEYSPSIKVVTGEEDNVSEGPGNVVGVGGENKIMITWTTPPNIDDKLIITYIISYKVAGSGDPYTEVDIKTNTTAYELIDLRSATEYEFFIFGKMESGNTLESEIVFVATSGESDGEGGELSFSSAPSVVTTNSSASITWGTSKSASSQVYYGATDEKGYMSEKLNTTPRVKGHTIVLNNLTSCTVYSYKVSSFDAEENMLESSGGDFTTKGCKGDATVITYQKGQVTASTGVTLTAKESGRGLSVTVPAAVVTGKEVAIQAIKVSQEEVKEEISKPDGKIWVGGSYVLNAIEDAVTEVTSFDKSVSVSIDYQNSDIVGIDPNTLKIWHYEDSVGWRELSSCSTYVNGVGGTVTCQTTSFSVFGIFGEASSPNSTGNNTGGGSGSSTGNIPKTQNTPTNTASDNPMNNQTENNNHKFTKDLWYQVEDIEVKLLQRFLNAKGFIVSETGPGSSGEEAEYFGPKTKEALIKFQEQYKIHILTPLGLTVGTGFFGPQTRNFINSL